MSKLLKKAAYLQDVIDYFDLWSTSEHYHECVQAIAELKYALEDAAVEAGIVSNFNYLEVYK